MMPHPLIQAAMARAVAAQRRGEPSGRRSPNRQGRHVRPVSRRMGTPRAARRERVMRLGIATFALSQLASASWMLVAPPSFFRVVGPFGVYNAHYVLDAAAFTGGLGAGLLVSLRWPALRAGALVTGAAITILHAVNHWVDVSSAHPGSNAGVIDAVSLTIGAGLAAAMALTAVRRWGA